MLGKLGSRAGGGTRADVPGETRVHDAVRRDGAPPPTSEAVVEAARRTRALVARQLDLLDVIEAREDEPDALRTVLELQHLVSRVRRDAEGVLVLAGVDGGVLPGDSVSLSRLVGAAADDVAARGRVNVRLAVDGALLGRSASLLRRLLAELVDNAVRFSHDRSRVLVSSEATADGVDLVIVDHGLGMDDDVLEAANAELREPGGLPSAQTLGLPVVGRLAQRLGAAVVLRGGVVGGTVVTVSLPAAAFEHGFLPVGGSVPALPVALEATDAARTVRTSQAEGEAPAELPSEARRHGRHSRRRGFFLRPAPAGESSSGASPVDEDAAAAAPSGESAIGVPPSDATLPRAAERSVARTPAVDVLPRRPLRKRMRRAEPVAKPETPASSPAARLDPPPPAVPAEPLFPPPGAEPPAPVVVAPSAASTGDTPATPSTPGTHGGAFAPPPFLQPPAPAVAADPDLGARPVPDTPAFGTTACQFGTAPAVAEPAAPPTPVPSLEPPPAPAPPREALPFGAVPANPLFAAAEVPTPEDAHDYAGARLASAALTELSRLSGSPAASAQSDPAT